MDNMREIKLLNTKKIVSIKKIKILNAEKIINIKKHQSFNESNLMTLPFISLKRKRVSEINRTWIRDGKEVNLIVRGNKYGCPTIYELDVLMALLRIHSKNMDNKLVVLNQLSVNNSGEVMKQTNKVTNMPKAINFTYRGLAKEMGLKGWGKTTKKRLEDSILCLNECIVYSTLAVRNQEIGEYVIDFDGVESSGILKKYKSYNISKYKKAGKNLLSPKEVIEAQSIEIDDFFFKNLKNNFFKIYNYEIYTKLKMAISKKLLLILTQWSHGSEKYISMQTLFDYIGLENNSEKEQKYNYLQLRKALDELVEVGFIQNHETTTKGVNFIFNTTRREKERGFDKYTTDIDIVVRLREIGIDYEDITKYCNPDTISYIAGLLRYIDYRNEKGWIEDIRKFTLKGLPFNSYDVEEFIIQ